MGTRTTTHNGVEYWTCSICDEIFSGFGNNPWPVTEGDEDRCCDNCNSMKVIPARFREMAEETKRTADILKSKREI